MPSMRCMSGSGKTIPAARSRCGIPQCIAHLRSALTTRRSQRGILNRDVLWMPYLGPQYIPIQLARNPLHHLPQEVVRESVSKALCMSVGRENSRKICYDKQRNSARLCYEAEHEKLAK